jgi:hypothetical protein
MMDWIKVDRESAAATYDSTWKIFSEDDAGKRAKTRD